MQLKYNAKSLILQIKWNCGTKHWEKRRKTKIQHRHPLNNYPIEQSQWRNTKNLEVAQSVITGKQTVRQKNAFVVIKIVRE